MNTKTWRIEWPWTCVVSVPLSDGGYTWWVLHVPHGSDVMDGAKASGAREYLILEWTDDRLDSWQLEKRLPSSGHHATCERGQWRVVLTERSPRWVGRHNVLFHYPKLFPYFLLASAHLTQSLPVESIGDQSLLAMLGMEYCIQSRSST